MLAMWSLKWTSLSECISLPSKGSRELLWRNSAVETDLCTHRKYHDKNCTYPGCVKLIFLLGCSSQLGQETEPEWILQLQRHKMLFGQTRPLRMKSHCGLLICSPSIVSWFDTLDSTYFAGLKIFARFSSKGCSKFKSAFHKRINKWKGKWQT